MNKIIKIVKRGNQYYLLDSNFKTVAGPYPSRKLARREMKMKNKMINLLKKSYVEEVPRAIDRDYIDMELFYNDRNADPGTRKEFKYDIPDNEDELKKRKKKRYTPELTETTNISSGEMPFSEHAIAFGWSWLPSQDPTKMYDDIVSDNVVAFSSADINPDLKLFLKSNCSIEVKFDKFIDYVFDVLIKKASLNSLDLDSLNFCYDYNKIYKILKYAGDEDPEKEKPWMSILREELPEDIYVYKEKINKEIEPYIDEVITLELQIYDISKGFYSEYQDLTFDESIRNLENYPENKDKLIALLNKIKQLKEEIVNKFENNIELLSDKNKQFIYKFKQFLKPTPVDKKELPREKLIKPEEKKLIEQEEEPKSYKSAYSLPKTYPETEVYLKYIEKISPQIAELLDYDLVHKEFDVGNLLFKIKEKFNLKLKNSNLPVEEQTLELLHKYIRPAILKIINIIKETEEKKKKELEEKQKKEEEIAQEEAVVELGKETIEKIKNVINQLNYPILREKIINYFEINKQDIPIKIKENNIENIIEDIKKLIIDSEDISETDFLEVKKFVLNNLMPQIVDILTHA